MQRKLVINLIALIFLASCSNLKSKSYQHSGVPSGQNSNNIEISDDATGENENSEEDKAVESNVPRPKFLYLGENYFHSFSYVGLLKSIEKNKIQLDYLSGEGVGLLVAALYAKYSKSSLVEWQLFKLDQTIDKKIKIQDKIWRDSITLFIKEHFAATDFESLKIKICVHRKDETFVCPESGRVDLFLSQYVLMQKENNFETKFKELELADTDSFWVLPIWDEQIINDKVKLKQQKAKNEYFSSKSEYRVMPAQKQINILDLKMWQAYIKRFYQYGQAMFKQYRLSQKEE